MLIKNLARNETLWAAIFLLSLTAVGLAIYTPWLGLVGDDWWFLAHLAENNFLAAQFEANPARPMVAYLWYGLWQIFGLNLWVYYLLSFTVQWLASLLIFVLLRRIFQWAPARSMTAAAFFLLYPADTAHIYLSTLSTRVCVLLAVAGAIAWFYANMHSSRSKLLIASSLLLMALSLLAYETPLFLLALMPIVLMKLAWRGFRIWLYQAFTCYGLLAAYALFRVWVACLVAQRSTRFYVSVDLTPDWLLSQFQSLFAITTWKGWLYALKAMLDFGLIPAAIMLIGAMVILLPTLARLERNTIEQPERRRELAKTLGVGIILSAAGVLPAAISNVRLENAIGTLDGRLVHASALGHAIILTGLCALPGSLLKLQHQTRNLLWATLTAILLSVAVINGLGVQREYARSWRMQLNILGGLQAQLISLQDDTTVVFLEAPRGPFNIRFYYPYTQLLRRFYANPTLQALPWQKGFPPQAQLLFFGERDMVAVTEVVQGETAHFDYANTIGFRVEADGRLTPISRIDTQYFLNEPGAALSFPLPPDWRPAQTPIRLRSASEMATGEAPSATEWRQWLLSQMTFVSQYPLP